MAFRDRAGERVGRLTVICEAAPHPTRWGVQWLCRCDCGNEKVILSGDLGPRKATSCGCLRAETIGAINKHRAKHGHARSAGGNKRATSPEYNSWRSMLDRVNRPKAINYHLCGGARTRFDERACEACQAS